MSKKTELEKTDWKEKVAVYITYDGVPLFNLPYETDDDNYILMSSFLHTIDILAKETRKKIGRSADFYGFDLINNIKIEVIEIANEDLESNNKIRLFLQTPYGKEPINRSTIMTLFNATRAIISKIHHNEISLIHRAETAKYFKEKLKEAGYTPDRILSELKRLTESHFSNNMPISLFSIEKEEKDEDGYKLEEIGNYNAGNYKKNPVKNESGKLTFDPELIISLAGALKSYQSVANIKTNSITLRFRDYSLGFYYKKDGLPVISVFMKGTGNIEEMKRYHNNLRNLELEPTS
jgi:hypothetical protein